MSRSIRALTVMYVAAALIVGVACRREAEPASPAQPATSTTPPSGPPKINVAVRLAPGEISRCEAGTTLNREGLVENTPDAIEAGEPLHVSMWLNEAPQELQVSVKLLDEERKEITTARRDAAGAKVATLAIERKLAPGTYHLEGYWGGNLGCEKEIVLE